MRVYGNHFKSNLLDIVNDYQKTGLLIFLNKKKIGFFFYLKSDFFLLKLDFFNLNMIFYKSNLIF